MFLAGLGIITGWVNPFSSGSGSKLLAVAARIFLTVIAFRKAGETSQLFFAFTVTFPLTWPHVTVIEVVPFPALIDAPLGTLQTYVQEGSGLRTENIKPD